MIHDHEFYLLTNIVVLFSISDHISGVTWKLHLFFLAIVLEYKGPCIYFDYITLI